MSPVAARLAPTLASARTGGRDDWQTPSVVLERVRKVDAIRLDPCTSRDNPTEATIALTGSKPQDDGLAAFWSELVDGAPRGLAFVNPPYSTAKAWAEKMEWEALGGCPIIALVAARPDTRWWHRLWHQADVVGFWRGRITFVGASHPAPFPSAVFGFNVGRRRFVRAFGDVAEVVTP